MLTFADLTVNVPDYIRVESLYLSAFPADERRDPTDFARLLRQESIFRGLIVRDASGFVGFITYWDFPAYRYVEHFAISSACRGRGYGGRVIEYLKQSTDLPLLLEVEPPTTEQAVRRIRFYASHGFSLYDFYYVQPSYHPGGQGPELRLMATRREQLGEMTAGRLEPLLRSVYGVRTL